MPDYPVTVFFTREGYLKKITPQSLRTAGAHKLKEGDEIVVQAEARNTWKPCSSPTGTRSTRPACPSLRTAR